MRYNWFLFPSFVSLCAKEVMFSFVDDTDVIPKLIKSNLSVTCFVAIFYRSVNKEEVTLSFIQTADV